MSQVFRKHVVCVLNLQIPLTSTPIHFMLCKIAIHINEQCLGPPRGFGDSGRRAIYFQGFGENGHLFSRIWGESITFWGFREQGAEEKHFWELGRKVIFLSGSREQRLPPPHPGGASVLEPHYGSSYTCITYSKVHVFIFKFE